MFHEPEKIRGVERFQVLGLFHCNLSQGIKQDIDYSFSVKTYTWYFMGFRTLLYFLVTTTYRKGEKGNVKMTSIFPRLLVHEGFCCYC